MLIPENIVQLVIETSAPRLQTVGDLLYRKQPVLTNYVCGDPDTIIRAVLQSVFTMNLEEKNQLMESIKNANL